MVSARELSHQYATYLYTQLSGEEIEGIDFGHWLDEHWCEHPALPDEPCLDDMDGESPAGRPVTWIERGGEIVGLLAGRSRGCYRIPPDATPPMIALFLDDARECSTGSLTQERAFALGRETPAQWAPLAASSRLGADSTMPGRSPAVPLHILAGGAQPDPATEPSLGGLLG